MKSLILIFLMFSPVFGYAECLAPNIELDLNSMTHREPTLYVNGTMTIQTGSEYGQVVEVFKNRGESFSGLEITRQENLNGDDRSWFLKTFFPRPTKLPTRWITIKLRESARNQIQGTEGFKAYYRLQVKDRFYEGSFVLNSNISPNCRPLF